MYGDKTGHIKMQHNNMQYKNIRSTASLFKLVCYREGFERSSTERSAGQETILNQLTILSWFSKLSKMN